jgi:hypothetical protein
LIGLNVKQAGSHRLPLLRMRRKRHGFSIE